MNYLLDSSNAAIASVTFMGNTLAGPKGNVSFDGLPLGLVSGELALKIMGTGGGSGIPMTPPTVNGVKVVGVQETRSVTKNAATDATYTIPVGSLSYLVEFSSDFVGTVNGIARAGASISDVSDAAQPNNTLPAIAITRSAGNFTVTIGGV